MELPKLERLIVEPTKLAIFAVLYVRGEAEFGELLEALGTSPGNLSGHMRRLEGAGYVEVRKGFRGRRPRTSYRLSEEGRRAFEAEAEKLRRIAELVRALRGWPSTT